jgi:hypothetical protein
MHTTEEVVMRLPAAARILLGIRSPLLQVLAVILFTLGLAGGVVAGHYDFDARVATVSALLEAGQRLDTAHTGDKAFDTIRMVQKEAVAAYRDGRTEEGYQRLEQAYVLVQMVIRKLASDPVVTTPLMAPGRSATEPTGGQRARFETLEHSVIALEEAYRSIRLELGNPLPNMSDEISRLVTSARREQAAGRGDVAMRQMKEAYVLLQSEIVRLRGGQTLVNKVNFADDRAEYDYEVDRHDTHILLVELLLSQSRTDPEQAATIRTAVDESMRLHWVAHKHAAAGEYRQAIAWLELASDRLARLVRSYGHDIP